MDDLTKDYCRWVKIYFFGCVDPNWDDGSNINLVRTQILYQRKLLENDSDGRLFYDFPDSYSLPIPPTAPHLWLARERKKKLYCCLGDDFNYSRKWAKDFNSVAEKLRRDYQITE